MNQRWPRHAPQRRAADTVPTKPTPWRDQ
jgi:hypothetical protein